MSEVACERRRISGCRLAPPNQWQPEIRLRSQAMSEGGARSLISCLQLFVWCDRAGSPGSRTKNMLSFIAWRWGSGLAWFWATGKSKQFTLEIFGGNFISDYRSGGTPWYLWEECDTKCELTPAHATIIRSQCDATFDQWLCRSRVFWQRACYIIKISSYPPVALYSEVAVYSARRSKDFKMTKSLMLCVVALTFLCLGSSKHMEFKNCGKLSFQLRFLAIFVPM